VTTDRKPRKPPTPDARCGTNAGYQAHHRRGEDACDPCREGANEYHRGYYDRTNWEQRAKVRATAQLVAAHHDEWLWLVHDEMRRM
jgi:hypothetical protein